MIVVDTSGLVKLLVEEPESEALELSLRRLADAGEELVISRIAGVELRRVAIRLGFGAEAATPVLAMFRMLLLTEAMMQLAGALPQPRLRTLDALHLATALAVGARGMLTYDVRLADAARAEGLTVFTPTA